MRSFACSLGLLLFVGVGCAWVNAPGAPPSVDVTGVWIAMWDKAPWSGPGTLRLESKRSRTWPLLSRLTPTRSWNYKASPIHGGATNTTTS
jgi:hypothetical protein